MDEKEIFWAYNPKLRSDWHLMASGEESWFSLHVYPLIGWPHSSGRLYTHENFDFGKICKIEKMYEGRVDLGECGEKEVNMIKNHEILKEL